ncbi:MAG: hypothetical protein VX026_03035 [Myxococcota bacterium]|nr:hypothetical protein [Myxococcota bacterium]
MPSHSIEHNHESTHALPEGLALIKAQPLPILVGGILEFFCWVAIPAILIMAAQTNHDGIAKVGMWTVTVILVAFLFVTHAWIRQGSLMVQKQSITGKPSLFEAAGISHLPRPFIQWRLIAVGVYIAAFGVGILPGMCVGFIASSIESELLGVLGQTLGAILCVIALTLAQIALVFGDRLVVFSRMAPKAALKHSAQLGYQVKGTLLMFLIVGLALRMIGTLFCGVGIALMEILLDVSLTKAYNDSKIDISSFKQAT